MSDFLTRLAERTLGTKAVIRPDISPYFGPVLSGNVVDGPTRVAQQGASEVPVARSVPHEPTERVSKGEQTTVGQTARILAAATALDDSTDPKPRARQGSPAIPLVPRVDSGLREFVSPQAEAQDTPANTEPPRSPSLAGAPAVQVVATVQPRVAIRPERLHFEPSQSTENGTSTVQISIGRVEVRAIMPTPTPVQRAAREAPSAALSLDDYLRVRNRGRR